MPGPSSNTKRVVVYVGTADVREIDAASWRQVGVENQQKVVWDRAHGFEIPADQLTPDAVRYCEERDDGFIIKEVPA